MSKYSESREVAYQLYKDGKVHSIKEVRAVLAAHGIVEKKNGNMISNILFQLKKEGIIKMCETKGDYILADSAGDVIPTENEIYADESVSTEMVKTSVVKPNINMDDFIVIKPQKPRQPELKVTIIEAGEIRLNSALHKCISSQRIAVYLSKDLRKMILCSNGEDAMEFTKAGTAKNREITEILREKRIPFPASFTVKWNEDYGAWEGILNISPKK